MDLDAAVWRKSTYSGGNGGQCVEVAANLAGVVAVRDSKVFDGPEVLLSPLGWRSFVSSLKAGSFATLI
ncbi:DUF397 domain-containing protein [Sphaerisporangium sp. NPDC005289]|uniref:DUF397 domain-containing protein n=1 Tax=Sphaerisporangium sp. NPDC005289 TaxID=3155247 RepID=UPI0033AFE544